MLASLKSLKCQSGTEKKKKVPEESENEGAFISCPQRSPRPLNASAARRISRWRMECPLRDSDPTSPSTISQLSCNVLQRNATSRAKVATVNLERDEGTLGITLRGGMLQNSQLSSPVVITHLKPGGPADKDGTIMPGDRLVAVNGISIQGSTLEDAKALLKEPVPVMALTIEYDVKLLESVDQATGPLLVEIDRPEKGKLGIALCQSEGAILIDHIKTGSVSDRCGALRVGDEILAINGRRLDCPPLAVEDVFRLLEEGKNIRLEIMPGRAMMMTSKTQIWRDRGNIYAQPSVGSMKKLTDEEIGAHSSHGWCNSSAALTHYETLHVTLCSSSGILGIDLCDAADRVILIASVHPNSPAESCGCLYPGDRVLAINHRNVALDKLTAREAMDLLDASIGSKINLYIEFDVLDTVVPSSGIFNVRLIKRGSAGLGLTISAASNKGFIVWEVKRGSVAHRAGSLLPGDKLLEINGVPLAQCSAEQISHILYQGNGLITLKIERSNETTGTKGRRVTCTVELQRCGGPIGITIAGSEEPQQPITVSGLTPGGLAEQAGVLQIGDEILAINNHCLLGEPLSTAHALLQTSPDLVTLKVLRTIHPHGAALEGVSPNLPSSIDSAVESWDSSYFDLSPSPDNKSYPGHFKAQCDALPVQRMINHSTDFACNHLLEDIANENIHIREQLDLLSDQINQQHPINNLEQTNNIPFDPNVTIHSGESSETNTVKAKSCSNEYQHLQPLPFPIEPSQYVPNDLRNSCLEFEACEMSNFHENRQWQCLNTSQPSIRSEFQNDQLIKVKLTKDLVYEDFGFSVSDGLYDRGVYINRIRKSGPADLNSILQPFDRILKVNDTCTQDFDCCLTVPLIASSGDTLNLLVARSNNTSIRSSGRNDQQHYRIVDQELPTITLQHSEEGRRIIV